MNIKSMLIKLAEEQADKMQEEAMKHLGSDEIKKEWATWINNKINLPFMNEKQEQEFFEKMIDIGTDFFASLVPKLLKGIPSGK